jgi:hypothetical protein
MRILFLLYFTSLSIFAFAGKTSPDSLAFSTNNNQYYSKLENKLTVKLYTTQNTASFDIRDDSLKRNLKYNIERSRSLGAGASYKWLGVNVAYGFPFMNQQNSRTSKANFWNFQTQFHLRKVTLSLYANSFNGYYLENSRSELPNFDSTKTYFRPDINASVYGANMIYIKSPDRYSNKATFQQTEWQKKSAGTWVFGANALYYSINADSSLVPVHAVSKRYFNGEPLRNISQYSCGGGVGYAFHLIGFKHLFLNAMLMVGLNVSSTKVSPAEWKNNKKLHLNPMVLSSIGIGYNSEKLYIGIMSSNYSINANFNANNTSVQFNTGNMQMVIAWRFQPKRDLLTPQVNRIKSFFSGQLAMR